MAVASELLILGTMLCADQLGYDVPFFLRPKIEGVWVFVIHCPLDGVMNRDALREDGGCGDMILV